MNVEMEFTDDEIREELARLGYKEVPDDKLAEFKTDLMKLIHTERSRSSSVNSSVLEQRDEDLSPRESVSKPRVDPVQRNFTNHGSQWLDKEGSSYLEDWHYKGQDSGRREKHSVPGSYALFELPGASRYHEGDDNNCRDDVSTDSEQRFMKRKTSRRNPAGCRTVDESFTETDAAGIFEIYEKIKTMAMRDCKCVDGTDKPEPPYRLKSSLKKTPSVIKTNKEPPHTRNIVRCNPSDRMKMYAKMWKSQPVVGETTRDDLRKAVHAKLLKKDGVHLDKKIYIPNNYVVPTSKHRSSLRWEVRTALENYEIPPQTAFHG